MDRFRDNWDLSAARAIEAFKIVSAADPRVPGLRNTDGQALLGVSGYAETRPVHEGMRPESEWAIRPASRSSHRSSPRHGRRQGASPGDAQGPDGPAGETGCRPQVTLSAGSRGCRAASSCRSRSTRSCWRSRRGSNSDTVCRGRRWRSPSRTQEAAVKLARSGGNLANLTHRERKASVELCCAARDGWKPDLAFVRNWLRLG